MLNTTFTPTGSMASSSPAADPGLDQDADQSMSLEVLESRAEGYHIPQRVLDAIYDVEKEGKRVVVMTCGIAGSGKSTLSRALQTTRQFTRLSIDAFILRRHGVYNVNYPPERLDELQDEAEVEVKITLRKLLSDYGPERDVEQRGHGGIILDLSFYCKSDRDFYRSLIAEEGGGNWGVVLVVFKPSGSLEEMEGVLWERIEGREREIGEGKGREGMPVSRELLGCYLKGFQWPNGEGEVRVDVVRRADSEQP